MENRSERFIFWQRWLFVSAIVFAVFGIVFAFSGDNFLMLPYDKIVAHSLWGTETFSLESEKFKTFIYGPLGATIACCYILLAFIAYYPFKEKKKWARNSIVVAFTFWVVIDSAMCFRFNVLPQVYVINLFSIVVKMLPLVFTWKHFS